MRKIFTILSVILLAIIFTAVLFHNYSKHPKFQFETKRQFADTLQLSNTIDLSFDPGLVLEIENGYLTKDTKTQRVIKLSSNGKREMSFSTFGLGRRSFITDYCLTGNNIYLADAAKNLVAYTNTNDSIVAKYIPKVKFNRSIRINDSTCIAQRTVTVQGGSKIDFIKLNFVNNTYQEIPELNKIFASEKFSNLFYEGFFTKGAGDRYYYVCYLTNNIIGFNSAGSVLFNGKAIYNVIKPHIITENGYTMAGESVIVTTSIAADQRYLYVLSNIGDKSHASNRIIDLYDANSGAYRKSIIASNFNNQPPTDISLGKDYLYMSYPHVIAAYSTKQLL